MRKIKDKNGWPEVFKAAQIQMERTGYRELPKRPRKHTCYNYYPEGAMCANGNPWMGMLRLENSKNLMIVFAGGGEAVDDYSAQRPTVLYPTGEPKFYFNDVYFAELLSKRGLCMTAEQNPFRDWNLLVIPYATGDFHCGTNDYRFVDEKGNEQVIYQHGYFNYRHMVDKIKEFLPNPEKLLVVGSSAGAFGTAMLSSDIMEHFPECNDVTFCVDSAAQIIPDLQRVVNEMWKAPASVASHISSNLVLDSLTAMHEKYSHRAKVLYLCSHRDAALVNMQNYLDGRGMIMDKEGGDRFFRMLRQLVQELRRRIPNIGLFIFDTPLEQVPGADLTIHTLTADEAVFTVQSEGICAARWIWDGINGNVRQLGLHLLDL